MKFYKFDELEFVRKPNIIKIIGPGMYNKDLLSNKLIISIFDRLTKNSINLESSQSVKLELTIFTNEFVQFYPLHIQNITQYYRAYDKMKDFYLLRKYHLKKNPNTSIHILLINYNLICKGTKKKYLQKLIDNYEKLNLVIIIYEYFLLKTYKEADYFLFIGDCFESNIKIIYNLLVNKNIYEYNKFKKIFTKITYNDGIMVLKKDINNKLYKLNELYDKEKERIQIKRTNPNYNPLSDDSNIIFF